MQNLYLFDVVTAWSVRIWSFSGSYFPAFGLNTEITEKVSVFSPNARNYRPENSEYRHFLRSLRENTDQKTPNTDTFYAVWLVDILHVAAKQEINYSARRWKHLWTPKIFLSSLAKFNPFSTWYYDLVIACGD